MAIFTISTFAELVKFLIAARSLAKTTDILDRSKTLAELASQSKTIREIFTASPLSKLAQTLETTAKTADRAFKEDGTLKEDARKIFFLVAPETLADQETLVGSDLNPDKACMAMIAVIAKGKYAYDFAQTTFAEAYFKAVMSAVLRQMLADDEYAEALKPAVWQRILAQHNVQLHRLGKISDDTTALRETATANSLKLDQLNELVRTALATPTAHDAIADGLTEIELVSLAQEIANDTSDKQEAVKAIRDAFEDARSFRKRDVPNDSPVAPLIKRVKELRAEGRLHDAQNTTNTEIEALRLRQTNDLLEALNIGVQADIAVRDYISAARKIAEIALLYAELDAPGDKHHQFVVARQAWAQWYKTGANQGNSLHLRIATELSRNSISLAPDEESIAIGEGDLGVSLQVIGRHIGGQSALENSLEAFAKSLSRIDKVHSPETWAMLRINQSNALETFGEYKDRSDYISDAIQGYSEVIDQTEGLESSQKWTMAMNHRANSRIVLAKLTQSSHPLLEAINDLEEVARRMDDPKPTQAYIDNRVVLGNAYKRLGERSDSPDFGQWFSFAEQVYDMALALIDPENDPVKWASIKTNIAATIATKGELASNMAELSRAYDLFEEILAARPADKAPIEAATTLGSMGRISLILAHDAQSKDFAQRAVSQLSTAVQQLRAAGHQSNADNFASLLPAVEDLLRELEA